MNPTTLRREPLPVAAAGTWSQALARHWPEYLMEAAELGAFMVSACLFTWLLGHPRSPAVQVLASPTWRRVLSGIAMGATAAAIIYSPWGKQSGAHFNPAVTLTFWRLGKIDAADAAFYVGAQFAGALAGTAVAAAVLGTAIADPAVNWVATVPGVAGPTAAFLAELAISFALMTLVLVVSNTPSLAGYTGLFCGVAVATYIALEAPLSGMSMNPARSFAPAVFGGIWSGLWIYFVAPPLGMLLAAESYLRLRGRGSVACAKLHHRDPKRCIFCRHLHA